MSRINQNLIFFKESKFNFFTNFKKDFFFTSLTNLLYYDYYFYLNNFAIINNYKFIKANNFLLKSFKNFFNSLFLLLNQNYRFLCLDFSYKNNFFKNLFFSD